MRKSIKFVSMLGAVIGLAFGGAALNNQNVKADATETINIPTSKGYTKANILKANNGKLNGSAKAKLVAGSMAGMKDNKFSDDDTSDNNTIVDVTKLTDAQKVELSDYALDLINSARSQMNKEGWTYKKGALHFADKVATNYDEDHASCWDSDHDVRGIERAAKTCGLNSTVGQVYEDEAGLPVTSEWQGTKRESLEATDLLQRKANAFRRLLWQR